MSFSVSRLDCTKTIIGRFGYEIFGQPGKLGKALQRVNSIIGSRSMLPILGNVMLKAGDNQLRLTTTDLEIRIETAVEAVVEVAGETTVPARKLAALVGCFVGTDVEVSVNENHHMQLKCGSSNFTLLGLSPADFPNMVEVEAVREIKIREIDFKGMTGFAFERNFHRRVADTRGDQYIRTFGQVA